jgi:hypothetical protein
MASLRSIMNCIGADTSGQFSVLRRFFGFRRSRVPADPDTSVTASVSLLTKMRSLEGRHIHLNVIRVGFDLVADEDEALEKLDYAIYRIHRIYLPVNLGVGRILHFILDSADADGADDLGSPEEADELSDDWSVHNSGIDVFVVRNISDDDFVGVSPVGGSCDKPSGDDGLVGGEIGRSFEKVGRTFAHEVGHFLGLPHNHDDDDCPTSAAGLLNLMAQTGCVNSVRDAVQLTSGQGGTMREHCSVRDGC